MFDQQVITLRVEYLPKIFKVNLTEKVQNDYLIQFFNSYIVRFRN